MLTILLFTLQSSIRRWQSFCNNSFHVTKCKALASFSYHYFCYLSKEFQGVGSPSANIAFYPSLAVFLLALLEQCEALSVLLQPLFPCNEMQGVGSPSAAIVFFLFQTSARRWQSFSYHYIFFTYLKNSRALAVLRKILRLTLRCKSFCLPF